METASQRNKQPRSKTDRAAGMISGGVPLADVIDLGAIKDDKIRSAIAADFLLEATSHLADISSWLHDNRYRLRVLGDDELHGLSLALECAAGGIRRYFGTTNKEETKCS